MEFHKNTLCCSIRDMLRNGWGTCFGLASSKESLGDICFKSSYLHENFPV